MRVSPISANSISYNNTSITSNNKPSECGNRSSITFGAKAPSSNKFIGFFKNIWAKTVGYYNKVQDSYGKMILQSKKIRAFSESLYKKDTTNATKHFAVLGALVTSSAYAYNTLKNNNLEKRNSTTLAINQALGWIVPTTLGYLIDASIADHTKEIEYKFAAKLTKAMKMAGLTNAEHEAALERAVKQIKGVRTLAGITTFTLLYRYLAPVAITPLANKIGAWVGSKVDSKNAAPETNKA